MDATVSLSRPGPVYSATAAGTSEVVRVEREESEADQLVADLYHAHYTSLVRLATLLLRNHAMAEEAVQDAFVALHARWRKRGRPREAVPYLRRSVINNVRSVQRRWTVAARRPDDRPLDMPSAESSALRSATSTAVVEALRTLPIRQREALVLRYYAGLPEAEIAAAMGVSRGAVKSHTSRGMATLRARLESWS